MRIGTEQLAAHLKRGLKTLYTVHGAEALLAFEATDSIRMAARAAGFSEREVLTAEPGFDWNRLAMSTASLSLFGEKKLLELRIPSGKPGVEGARAIEALCARLSSDMICLIQLPEIDWQGQKSAWFKALDVAGAMITAEPVGRERLPEWISGRLAAQNQQAAPQALRFLADRMEGNLLAAYQEIQKLALLFAPGPLSLEQVEQTVVDVARFDVFKLGEAILAADVPRLAHMLEGLQGEGEAPPLVLWAIAAEIRALLAVQAAQRNRAPLSQAQQREHRLWGKRQAQIEQAAKQRSRADLEAALLQAAGVDRIIKGLARGEVWDALLQLALLAAGKPALRPVLI